VATVARRKQVCKLHDTTAVEVLVVHAVAADGWTYGSEMPATDSPDALHDESTCTDDEMCATVSVTPTVAGVQIRVTCVCPSWLTLTPAVMSMASTLRLKPVSVADTLRA
jgi:hypothetical protein